MGSFKQKLFVDSNNYRTMISNKIRRLGELSNMQPISLNTQVESDAKTLVLEGKCGMMEMSKLKKYLMQLHLMHLSIGTPYQHDNKSTRLH